MSRDWEDIPWTPALVQKIYPWITDGDALCDNCMNFEKCGHAGWLCGNWTRAGDYQLKWEMVV